jgi:hypothetical protein
VVSGGCEHERAEHAATQRLTRATWCLCLLTALLCVVTLLLADATWIEKQRTETPAAQEVTAHHR